LFLRRLDWIDWLPGLNMPDDFFAPDAAVEFRRFDSYDAFLSTLREGPVPPAPPLYNYLLDVPD
jgi:hypothetical protein